MAYIVETSDLVKKYGKKTVLDRVSIHVKKGEIYGLIGQNGAGKTTLMKIILGITAANSGSMHLFGGMEPMQARKKIGSLIETPALYKNESAYENMKRFSLLCGSTEAEIRGLLELVGLHQTGKKKVKAFSLGMRQRLGIAVALMGNPELLILDEPVNGLDPAGIKEIRDLILKLSSRGVTVIISSHLLDELGKIATYYGILSGGVLVEEISAQQLEQKRRSFLRIITDNGAKAAECLRSWDPAIEIEQAGNVLFIHSPVADVSQINRMLVQADIRVYELKNESIGIETFFIERMGRYHEKPVKA